MIRLILFLTLFIFSNEVLAQTFDKSFGGQWAMTSWQFDFNLDGTFTRTSQGHFGDLTYTGTYEIVGDTLTILTGFEGTHGTVNEHYFIDENSKLVDLTLLYDYALDAAGWTYVSEVRSEFGEG